MARLRRLLKRNKDLSLKTKVLFSSKHCGPCQLRKATFHEAAAQDLETVHYIF